MKAIHAIALMLPLLAAACTPGSRTPDRQANAPQGMFERLNQKHGYVQDKQGNWTPSTNKRSSFESAGSSPYFKGSRDTKRFNTDAYGKKSWSGRSLYNSKSYDTATNTSITGRDAGLTGQAANITEQSSFSGTSYHDTGTIDTGNARENAGRRWDKPSDAETDIRRRVFQQPEVTDYKKQRELSVEESRGILGR